MKGEGAPALAVGSPAFRWGKALGAALRVLRRNPAMGAGACILLLVIAIAALAPWVARADPVKTNPVERLKPPSAQYWFGTDHTGRQVYARTIYGSRISLVVGFAVGLIVAGAGAVIGLVSGYYRAVDNLVMRGMDGVMAFPALLLALALIALLGSSLQNVIIAISVVETPRTVRVVRASVLSLREQDFVTAARAVGAEPLRVLGVHILPNIVAPLLVQTTFVFALAVIVEANLSFLGAGTPPYIPTWGNIMGQGRTYLQLAPWVTFFPGLFLSLTVLAINLVGDGLRDALDPKLARRL